MPTQAEVPEIIHALETKLANAAKRDVRLKVSGHSLDDGWLYVVVTPSVPGGSASDHARLMSQVERELRQEGKDHVLIVPALED